MKSFLTFIINQKKKLNKTTTYLFDNWQYMGFILVSFLFRLESISFVIWLFVALIFFKLSVKHMQLYLLICVFIFFSHFLLVVVIAIETKERKTWPATTVHCSIKNNVFLILSTATFDIIVELFDSLSCGTSIPFSKES